MAKRSARGRRSSERKEPPQRASDPSIRPRALATAGSEAAGRWLRSIGVPTIPRWHVEITITADIDSTFELNVYEEEWGFAFHHDGRGSWIRVTDIPFVHGRDDFKLVARTPQLIAINGLMADLEAEHGITLRRANASIRTNIPNATEIVREWLLQPPPSAAIARTIQLCGNEMHEGIRCTKPKGHDGDHEYQGRDQRGQLRWK